MKLTQIFQNEYARLEVSPENMFIQLTWLQHASGDAFRQVLQEAQQYPRSQGAWRWLNDMRKLNYVTLADQLWTVKEFLPAFDLRLQYRTACVVSLQNVDLTPDTLIQETLEQNPAMKGSMELGVFLDMEEAKFWLFL
ncbi:hypothetical protein [Botryobacter ruber]|uniref:hypothetical protein n=1 Tax=Botryobacter ruber TaxID=2171629 RepID=UPI000FEC652E|nr:hypothetical protein [Botryobacter ruber]